MHHFEVRGFADGERVGYEGGNDNGEQFGGMEVGDLIKSLVGRKGVFLQLGESD